jgi:O-antigen/teichoic acid export membrane protein
MKEAAQIEAVGTAGPGGMPRWWHWLRLRVRRVLDSTLAQQVSSTLLARMLLLGIGVVLGAITARILGPEGRGILATAETLAAVGVQFGILGLQSANTYLVSRQRNLLGELLGNSFLVSVGLGGTIAFVACTCFAAWPGVAPLQGVILIVALLTVPVRLCAQLLQSLLVGIQEIHTVNVIDVLSGLLSVVLFIPFLFVWHMTPAIAVSLSLAVSVAMAGGMLFRLRRHTSASPGVSLSLLRNSFAYGSKLYVACLVMFLVLRIDILMLRYCLEAGQAEEQIGYYSVAVSMGDLVCMVPTLVGALLFPRLSALSDPSERWRMARQAAGVVALFAAGVGTLLAVFSAPLVRLLYGPEFAPAAVGFLYLMPGVVMLSVNVIFMNYFAANGIPPITIWSPAVAAVINIAANCFAIPYFGFIGAAVTSTFAYGIMLAFSAHTFFRGPGEPLRATDFVR